MCDAGMLPADGTGVIPAGTGDAAKRTHTLHLSGATKSHESMIKMSVYLSLCVDLVVAMTLLRFRCLFDDLSCLVLSFPALSCHFRELQLLITCLSLLHVMLRHIRG